MNSITIIAIIVALLACLVCYALVSQALEQRRQHRQRLLTALQVRVSNFKYMLNSFPQGFLTRDLLLLVQRGLVDACEQMVRLDPQNAGPRQDLQAATQQMRETRTEPAQSGGQVSMESLQQIQDSKQCLEELYKVVHQQEGRQALDPATANAYRAQIRHLVLGITADAYILQGHQARAREKPRLAQHYFELALKLLTREDASGAFNHKKTQLKNALREMQARAQELGAVAQTPPDENEQAEIDRAWEKFNQAEESWKKKNLYD